MSVYSFCNGCQSKVYEYNESGKLIKFTCPALFNPFDDEKCVKHDRFIELESRKHERKERR